MTTDLSVYRSDREQLLARVRELEVDGGAADGRRPNQQRPGGHLRGVKP